jgi:peptide/nickel transport system permease protein
MLVVALAVVGPFVSPYAPTTFQGIPFGGPTGAAPLGYDELGRDVLSRVLNGGWELLAISAAATVIGVGIGTVIGVLAAHSRGWLDGVIMRTADVVLAFPQLVLALLLVSVAGSSILLIILAVALSHIPQVARVVRAAALDVCERDYVKAVELLRIPRRRVIFGEIMPGVTAVIMVEVGLRLTYSILIIAGLTFLGFGIQPPAANWGLMINENRIGITQNVWAVAAPAGLIAILTIGMNTFTDAIARVVLGVDEVETTIVGVLSPRVGEL